MTCPEASIASVQLWTEINEDSGTSVPIGTKALFFASKLFVSPIPNIHLR